MQPVSQAVLLSWSVPPAASFALALTALVYLRGWILLRRARVPFLPPWRAVSFFAGLLSLWIALASPLDVFSGFVLTAHMLQHMMLMMVAPPLILLGAPLIPLVRGLPVFAAREFAGPFLNWRAAIRVGHALTRPVVALILMGGVMFAWHTPRLYGLALSSGAWHEFEHACFFLTSLIFWWPVVQPWPSRSDWPRWAVVPYLLIGDLQNTILSAILVFSDRVVYPSYATVPRLFGFTPLHDQAAAGSIMWVVGSVAFVIPAIVIAVQLLQGKPESQRPWAGQSSSTSARVPRSVRVPRSSPPLARAGDQPSASPAATSGGSFNRPSFEKISFVTLFLIAGLCLATLASTSSDDDDQALRLSQQSGPFAVAVFALPGNLAAGEADFSVLVQDRYTDEVLQDAIVDLQAHSPNQALQPESVRATTSASENKLLQSASVDLPVAGDWTLGITVQRGSNNAEFTLPLHIVPAAAGFTFPLPYFVLTVFAALLMFVYLRRHRTTNISTTTVPTAIGAPEERKPNLSAPSK